MKVVAAIPCHNEARFIGDVVLGALPLVDHVVVIDDGSTDDSEAAARAAGARVIRHPSNRGYGAAIASALHHAIACGADVLVTLDGDGQHDPAEIPRVAQPILDSSTDLAIGSRFLGAPNNVPAYRGFGISVITGLFNVGSRVRTTDAQSGFRAYRVTAFSSLLPADAGMGASVELLVRARARRLRFKDVPVSCKYHPAGSSLNPVLHGLGVALKVLRFRGTSLLAKPPIGHTERQ